MRKLFGKQHRRHKTTGQFAHRLTNFRTFWYTEFLKVIPVSGISLQLSAGDRYLNCFETSEQNEQYQT